RVEEAAQLRRRLAQLELDLTQRVTGNLQLRRQPFERRDRTLGGRREVTRPLAVLRRERSRRGRRPAHELRDVTKALALRGPLIAISASAAAATSSRAALLPHA